jgi:hypothetical protein
MIGSTRLFTYLGFRLSGDLGKYTMYTYCKKRPTFFLKAPPLTPSSRLQRRQRNRFLLAGYAWRNLTVKQRATWQFMALRIHSWVGGYGLFVHWLLTHDNPALETWMRQSGLNPLDPP